MRNPKEKKYRRERIDDMKYGDKEKEV